MEEYLPEALLQQLNLDHMQLLNSTFVDEEMRQHQSDMLYEVGLANGGQALAYMLFEHKSYPDELVALQLLRYELNIWEERRRAHLPLHPILPIVVYHGEAKWPISTQFADILPIPEEMRPYTPHFHYHLTDLSHLSEVEIKGGIRLRVTLAVLRSIFDPNLRDKLPDLINLAFELTKQQTGLEYIRTILYYLTKATGKVSRGQMNQALLAQGELGEKVMMTIADEYIQEGIQKGLQQGLKQGLEQGLEKGLEKGLEQGLLQGFEQGLEQSILRILARRFGQYGEDVPNRLGELPPTVLELVLDEAVTAVDYPTFTTYLSQFAKPAE